MKNETWDSLKSVFNKRVSSPLYGALIISWCLWNWKLIYVTFFISESKLTEDKITYIISKSNFHYLICWPVISTIIIISILPFIEYIALFISLWFDKLKNNTEKSFQKEKTLTVQEGVLLLERFEKVDERYAKLLVEKDELIIKQNKQINILNENYERVKHDTTEFKSNITNLTEKITTQESTILELINSLNDLYKKYPDEHPVEIYKKHQMF